MPVAAFHPEDKSRAEIDAKLAACGWIVQNRHEMNLSAGPGVAVREFPTATGPADYALFVDTVMCGVIEAKADGTTLSGFSEQAAEYLSGASDYLPGRPEKRRFEYVSTGKETRPLDLRLPHQPALHPEGTADEARRPQRFRRLLLS